MNTSTSNFKDKIVLIAAACFLLFFVLSVIQGSAKNKSTSSPEITSETKVEFVDTEESDELSAQADTSFNEVLKSSDVLLENDLPKAASEDFENLGESSSSDRERLASEISSQIKEKMKSASLKEMNAATVRKVGVHLNAQREPKSSNLQAEVSLMSGHDNDADEETITAYQKSFLTDSVRHCKMKEFGVEFKCDLGWEMSEDTRPQDASIVVSQDPLVILNWKIFDQKIRFLGQLNKFFFEKIGVYQKGYASDTVDFAGRQAVLVKGLDQKDPTMNRRDYFYLNNEKLVCVSFSYSAQDKEKEGRKIIEEVKASFLPLEK